MNNGNNTIQHKPRTIFLIIGLALSAYMITSNGLATAFGLIVGKDMSLFLYFHDHHILYLLISYAFIYGVGFVIYWLIMRNLPHSLPEDQTFSFKELFQFFCIAYSLGISSNIIGTAISMITGNKTDITSAITDMVGTGGLVAGFIMIIVAPAIEELIFRKFIIDRTKKYGEKYAIVFSALCFGLFHMNLQQFIYAASIGMVFGFVYSRSGKIQYTMVMHSIINAIGYLVVLLAAPMLETLQDVDISSLIGSDGYSWIQNVNYPSLILLWIAEQAILAIIAMGIVFFIRKVRRVRFDYMSPECLPKKDVVRTIYLNIGVILFIIICIAGMVISFMGGVSFSGT